MKCALYDDEAGGGPGALLATSAEITNRRAATATASPSRRSTVTRGADLLGRR